MAFTWELILGPSGLVVGLIAALFVLVRTRIVVPGPYYEQSERRVEALEAENDELTKSAALLREQLAAATVELRLVREQLTRIEAELAEMRRQRGGGGG